MSTECLLLARADFARYGEHSAVSTCFHSSEPPDQIPASHQRPRARYQPWDCRLPGMHSLLLSPWLMVLGPADRCLSD